MCRCRKDTVKKTLWTQWTELRIDGVDAAETMFVLGGCLAKQRSGLDGHIVDAVDGSMP